MQRTVDIGELSSPTAASLRLGGSTPWLFSRNLDLTVFLGSAVLSLLADGKAQGTKGEPIAPDWIHRLVKEDAGK